MILRSEGNWLNQREGLRLLVRLYPPLNNTAGVDEIAISMEEGATLDALIDKLVKRFGPAFRQNLFDDRDLLIPSWTVFVNGRPVRLNRAESLETSLREGDELSFLLALSGG